MPSICTKILTENQNPNNAYINLQGLALGDGYARAHAHAHAYAMQLTAERWTDPVVQASVMPTWSFNTGLVDENQAAQAQQIWLQLNETVAQENWTEGWALLTQLRDYILNCSGNPVIYGTHSNSNGIHFVQIFERTRHTTIRTSKRISIW